MAVRTAIGIGSNVGNRSRHLAAAVAGLARAGAVVAVSPTYETAPVGGPNQAAYFNSVVVVDTELSPSELLERCLSIERDRGRVRRVRWGPRTLDLDVLLYDDETVDEPGLQIPHPRMTERRFVLQPLLDAWPDAKLPDGTPLVDFLPGVADQDVRMWGSDSR